MNGSFKLVLSIVACFTLLLSISVLSHADNDFGATTQALQEQGFIRPDTGGPLGSGEMALDPFRNADQLNHGGLFGPLEGSSPAPGPKVNYYAYGTLRYGAPVGPDTRSMGFDRDADHYMPITPLRRVD